MIPYASFRVCIIAFVIVMEIISTQSQDTEVDIVVNEQEIEGFYPYCLRPEVATEIGVRKDVEIDSECVFMCPEKEDWICGSDMHNYRNLCFLCRAACMRPKTKVGIKNEGRCPIGDEQLQERIVKRKDKFEKARSKMLKEHSENFPDHFQLSDEL